jgi:hypothetical protein
MSPINYLLVIVLAILALLMLNGCSDKRKFIDNNTQIKRTLDEEVNVICYETERGLSCVSLN